eukprot:g6980.t1
MTAAFAREADDACLLCDDPAFSYFLVSGSVLPIDMASTHTAPSPLAFSPLLHSSSDYTWHRVPTVEVDAVTEPKVGEMATGMGSPKGGEAEAFPRPAACEGERRQGLAFLSWTYPYSNNSTSGSALNLVHGNGAETSDDGGDVGSAVSKSLFPAPTTTPATASASPCAPDADPAPSTPSRSVAEGVDKCPIMPGQSLDIFLHHRPGSSGEKAGSAGNHDEEGHAEVESVFPEGSTGDSAAPRRWRLEAQERVCVGRVSLRLFQELKREEPKHDVEVKAAFLRKTEVFGDGFSVAILDRLAVLMVRHEQPAATVVQRKGAAVDKVVIIESGEAIRLGDRQADSMKNHSSLRIRTGQMFGGEEVPQPEVEGDDDDAHTLRLSQKTAAKSRSIGDLPSKQVGGLAGAPGGTGNLFAAAGRGQGKRGVACREGASPASPDFRRLGPSDHRSTPLAGCAFNALPVEFLDVSRPASAVGNENGGNTSRVEILMARHRPASRSKGKQRTRHERQGATQKRPAPPRPTTAPAPLNDPRRRMPLEDKRGVGWLNAPLGEGPPRLLGGRSGDNSGLEGGAGGVGDVDANDRDSGFGLTDEGIHQALPFLSTQTTSSPGSASASPAATLGPWTTREVVAAKRALSCRPQRTRVCLALRARASTSAGMAAAQRSHRGAFVMSKMGDAKARSTWRP